MIQIETGVPVPKHSPLRRYPFSDLAVSESFLVTDSNSNSICANASRTGKKLGRKFHVRKTKDGIRVWRVA